MSIEKIPSPEVESQLVTLESYQYPQLQQDLARYNLLTPGQNLIFMVYDNNGHFTYVHKFSSEQTPAGVVVTYTDNEHFQNKGLPLGEYEDYTMETKLLYRPAEGFSVQEVSPAIRDFLDIVRDNQIEDLEESRKLLEEHGQDARYSALSYEVQGLIDRDESLSEILAYIENEIEKIQKGEFDDEELIIRRTWNELKRLEEDAEFKSAEVITGDKKSVARQLYAWGRARREDPDGSVTN